MHGYTGFFSGEPIADIYTCGQELFNPQKDYTSNWRLHDFYQQIQGKVSKNPTGNLSKCTVTTRSFITSVVLVADKFKYMKEQASVI